MTFDDRQVCVLSKGRPDAPSLRWFPRATAFVEPAELDAYRAANPEAALVSVEHDDFGAVNARLFVHRWAAAACLPVVVLDDDLRALHRRMPRRRSPYERTGDAAPAVAAILADVTAGPYAAAAVGMSGAFPAHKRLTGSRGIVRQFYALNPRRVRRATVDPDAHPLGDLDFTLQLLHHRVAYHVRYDHVATLDFGGYDPRTEHAIAYLTAKWGTALTVRRAPDGALRSVSPNYRSFTSPHRP